MASILVVEDSPDIRELVRVLLESAGHEVMTASDGQEGVALTRERHPNLVLMDLSLPVLSGWEATREIKADPDTASIPVIAVTAHAMQGDRERALAAGCDGFVAKPIDEETFASVVASFLGAPQIGRPELPKARRADDEHHPARIFLVEDQDEVADLLTTDLATDAHQIVRARSADEAQRLFAGDGSFDLAIVDVMLSPGSGYDLTSELIAASPEYLPVLLVTAGSIDRERGYAAGADDFIGKPVESAELRARARSLIRIGRAIRRQGETLRERAEAYEKLAELDRLKSDFLSTVSHELRTPLNTIILLSHLIEREGITPSDLERRLHDVRVIRDSAETLLRMINNILDLAKLEAGQRDLHPQQLELEAFLRETTGILEPQAHAKSISMTLEVSPETPPLVVLDREKLSRVLINLLSNAVKYTKEGGVVLRAAPWQGSIAFEVEDTGVGIPEHLIAAAFEPFRQIQPRTGDAPRGTGLGLSISKQLVELMGGDLLFHSREGNGTRVSFTLPQIASADGTAPAPQARWKSGPTPTGITDGGECRRVLIVEDDASSRYGLKSLLESEGYEVTEASDLAEAERQIETGNPEVVVLDITLPDGDGAAWLASRNRKERVPFPVIALTGVTADEDRRRIERSGVSAVLHKPVNVHLLFDALRECAERKVGSP
ncbi:MAG: response regulator [Acidobacteriota bacterium]|nr:response regulator [Acidobacteriota bacterium]